MKSVLELKSRVGILVCCLIIFMADYSSSNAATMIDQTRNWPQSGELVLKSKDDFPDNLWVASEKLKRGKFTEAILICDQVIGIEKNNIQAHACLSAAYLGLGEKEKSNDEVLRLGGLAPDSVFLPIAFARVYSFLQNFQQAQANYKKGIMLTDDNIQYRLELGALYQAQNRSDEATEQYRLILKKKNIGMAPFVNANFALCKIDMQGKKYDKVITRARMMVDLYPPLEQSYNFLAYAYIGQQKPQKAIEVYELLKKNNLASALPFQEIPIIYLDKLDDQVKAIDAAQEGAGKFPKDAKSQDVLGWVFYKAQRNQDAVKQFEKALLLAPNHPLFLYHLGLALQDSGQSSRAATMFSRAIKLIEREKQPGFWSELQKRVEQCEE